MKKNKVRGYRNMLGMTQEQLGKELGITKQTYHNKEVGKNSFSDDEKITFKKLLLPLFRNITIEDIFF
ncbi:transcriptional regulator [Streptococcus pyogenes]|uniref:helix-turn-helix transcriptional regulator n=1 Tax=Streptococcus pyogenes TaxID=1314 RepID=UPI0010A18FDA|nr:helix-turn-helix transcriptional regulator [Streptococcus pyogenes]VGU90796.1 transcriptional regulator [Streptococcus pyogenes]VHB66058.1 transcriptional regulator [Streptococcus pyogenes]